MMKTADLIVIEMTNIDNPLRECKPQKVIAEKLPVHIVLYQSIPNKLKWKNMVGKDTQASGITAVWREWSRKSIQKVDLRLMSVHTEPLHTDANRKGPTTVTILRSNNGPHLL